MKTYLRTGAILLAFVGSVGLAAAQQPGQPAPMGTERGPMATTKQQTIQLTPAQRTQVYQDVIKDRSGAPAPAGISLRIGAKVPATVELNDLPDSVATQIPSVSRYKYVVAQNQVLLVDPSSGEVIEIIRQ